MLQAKKISMNQKKEFGDYFNNHLKSRKNLTKLYLNRQSPEAGWIVLSWSRGA